MDFDQACSVQPCSRKTTQCFPPANVHTVFSIQTVKFCTHLVLYFIYLFFLALLLSSFWTSRGTGVVPSPPRFLPSIYIAHRVQQSHCSSIFHRVLLSHALALSASQFVHEKRSQRIYTSMHSAGLELTKLTYTRLEDNLIRHRGDRLHTAGGYLVHV